MQFKTKSSHLGLITSVLLGLPLISGAQEAAPPATADQTVSFTSGNTHARTFEYAYEMTPIELEGVTIIAKHLEDGSRWALLNGSWYDLDQNAGVATQIAAQELSPPDGSHLAKKPKGSKAHRQYAIDLDYYRASVDLRQN